MVQTDVRGAPGRSKGVPGSIRATTPENRSEKFYFYPPLLDPPLATADRSRPARRGCWWTRRRAPPWAAARQPHWDRTPRSPRLPRLGLTAACYAPWPETKLLRTRGGLADIGVWDLAENRWFSGSGRPRGALKPSKKVGGFAPPPFWMVLKHPGAAQTPKTTDFQKNTIP